MIYSKEYNNPAETVPERRLVADTVEEDLKNQCFKLLKKPKEDRHKIKNTIDGPKRNNDKGTGH